LFTTPADLALNLASISRIDDTAVDLDGLLSIKVVITIVTVHLAVIVTNRGVAGQIVNFVALFDGASASVDDTFPLEVTVSRLCIRPEVLYTELEAAKLYDIALLQTIVMQN